MLFKLFTKLLRHFGFQMIKSEGEEAFLKQAGAERSVCVIAEDEVNWYVPADQAGEYLGAYNANPYFQTQPNEEPSSHPGHARYRFNILLHDYEQILHMMYFLQSGCVDAFYVDKSFYAYPDVIVKRHSVVSQAGEKEEDMLGVFLNAVKEHPDNAILQNYIGKLYIESGNIENASRYFVNACEKEAYYAEPYSNMGALLWNTDAREKAFKLFSEAFLRNPFDATIQDNFIKSGVALNAGDIMNEAINKTREYYPDYSGLMFLKALLLDQLGETEKCITALKEYIEQNPDDERAFKYLEELSGSKNGDEGEVERGTEETDE